MNKIIDINQEDQYFAPIDRMLNSEEKEAMRQELRRRDYWRAMGHKAYHLLTAFCGGIIFLWLLLWLA